MKRDERSSTYPDASQRTVHDSLIKINTAAQNKAIEKVLFELECLFEHVEKRELRFQDFMTELLATPFWSGQQYPNNPFPSLCMQLSMQVDDYADSLQSMEPAYHSRNHFQDVCLSLTLLLQQKTVNDSLGPNSPWLLSPTEMWLLLFCAIGHDYGHTGAINAAPSELEKKSIGLIRSFLEKSSLEHNQVAALMLQVEPILLATDPANLKPLLSKFASDPVDYSKHDCLNMLMVESDLMASALPNRGHALGLLLAQEWQSINPVAAASVKTSQGRLHFLQHIRFVSPHAIALGLEQIRLTSVKQLETA
jgi:hypothetical protein